MTETNQAFADKPRRVTCPSCGGDSLYAASNPFRPFCGERCKNIDLGAWSSEDFRLAAQATPDDDLDLAARPLQ